MGLGGGGVRSGMRINVWVLDVGIFSQGSEHGAWRLLERKRMTPAPETWSLGSRSDTLQQIWTLLVTKQFIDEIYRGSVRKCLQHATCFIKA